MKLTIGADPEVFVRHSNGHKLISAHDFPCGTKYQPKRTKHGHVQVDGTALEFNVRPARNKRDFLRNIKGVLNDLGDIVTDYDADCYLSFVPYALFTKEYLDKIPPHSKALGCSPDYNAYTESSNPMPDADIPIRTAAGHVHLGWGKFSEGSEHFKRCISLVKELDVYVGLPSLKWDPSPHRRDLYGKAGSFRPKRYGVEYRVLSNAWVDDDDLAGYVYSNTKAAFQNWSKGDLVAPEYAEFARHCIDTNCINWEDKAPKLADFLNIGDI